MTVHDIASALDRVRSRIRDAAQRAGRDAGEVTLVAVSKGSSAAQVLRAAAAGQRDFGENRAEEAAAKAAGVRVDGLRWHFVGRLQRNKVKRIAEVVDVVHSVDRVVLAKELGARVPRRVDVLVEVNVSGEVTKAGVAPDAVAPLVEEIAGVPGVRVTGLMTMAPRIATPEEARPYFRRLAELRDELDLRFPGAGIRELSMGMSQDYEIAVEEGATLVRVGTAIFGPRPNRGPGRDDRAGAIAPASLR
ncbi:MAG: YggS family pyridoxal phosphate-dependent enzyme [Actinomycetota bacterium]